MIAASANVGAASTSAAVSASVRSGQGAERQQQQTEQRVGREDVARPEQRLVEHADQQQAAHAPDVQRDEARARARHLQRDAVAEEQREERVDLVLERELDQPQRRVIGEPRIGARYQRSIGRREEVLGVLDEDAEQGRAAQHVEALEPRARRRRCAHAGGARAPASRRLSASPPRADPSWSSPRRR